MLWHEQTPERWEAEERIGRQLLDDCRSGVGEGGVAFVEGVFHVRSRHGHRYESVRLRVEYPTNFPDAALRHGRLGQPPKPLAKGRRLPHQQGLEPLPFRTRRKWDRLREKPTR